jgi:hypothetical protein
MPEPEEIDWEALSSEARGTVKIAALISAGFSPAEAGHVYGLGPRDVHKAMAGLRAEILAQGGQQE